MEDTVELLSVFAIFSAARFRCGAGKNGYHEKRPGSQAACRNFRGTLVVYYGQLSTPSAQRQPPQVGWVLPMQSSLFSANSSQCPQ